MQQKLADDARQARLELLVGLVNAVVAGVVLLIVVVTSVVVYVRAWGKRLFVRYLHGWTRFAANPVLIAAETVLSALVLLRGVVPWVAALFATPPDPGLPPPPRADAGANLDAQFAVTGTACLVSILIAVVVLRRRERTVIADRATD